MLTRPELVEQLSIRFQNRMLLLIRRHLIINIRQLQACGIQAATENTHAGLKHRLIPQKLLRSPRQTRLFLRFPVTSFRSFPVVTDIRTPRWLVVRLLLLSVVSLLSKKHDYSFPGIEQNLPSSVNDSHTKDASATTTCAAYEVPISPCGYP